MTTLRGCYQLVPPPQVAGFGFKRLKRGLKKAGRGVKKVGKKGARVAKKGAKVAVKVHAAPIKLAARAGKYALRATAKLAARPIISIVNKLAGRRAKFLAFKRTGSAIPTKADKKAGGQYAFSKLRKAGPIGSFAVRILKFTGGVTAGALGSWRQDAAMCGMTGAEIAAAAAAIIATTKKIMGALNKPGEAPADPSSGAKTEEPAEETQPTEEPAEEPAEEPSEEGDATEGFGRARLKKAYRHRRW